MARTSTINLAYGSNYMAICLNFPFSFSTLHATKILIVKNLLVASCLLLTINAVSAQQTPIHKNPAGIINSGNDWQFGINSGASFGINSKESSLFRGNGLATGLTSQYFFGAMGLGVNGGFINSKLNTSAINQFMVDRKFPLTSTVSSSASQNAYLLVGPSLRLGQRAQLIAAIKGGLFFNQSGGLVIGQQGAVRPLYRFDAGSKSLFPGFNGSLSFSYPVGSSSSLLLSTDFLQSSSSIQLYDPQRGIDIPVEQKRMFQTINAGISFIKTFNVKSPRDAGSGMSSGRRQYQTVSNGDDNNRVQKTRTKSNNSNDRIHGDPHVDEASIIDPENKRVVKTKTKSNQSNDRTTNDNCGPVTTKTTHPDGTIEEQTFSCPDDAANYRLNINNTMPNRFSMKTTVPKQTQGATFGEKVNQGLHAAGSNLVSGRIIHRAASGNTGIVSNRTLGGGGGGAAAASYAATGMVVNTGVNMNLYTREAGSGMASGKRSRDAGSGMATGRRQYQPFYSENGGYSCSTCLASVTGNPIGGIIVKGARITGADNVQQTLPSGNGTTQLEGVQVHLLNATTGAVASSTTTNTEGAFWFANVPTGTYAIEIDGTVSFRKGYDYYKAQSDMKSIDVAGEILLGNDAFEIVFDAPGEGTGVMKANIVTSRSNTKGIIVIGSDTDGDGIADRFTATSRLSDGRTVSINDITFRKISGATEIIIPFHPSSTQKASINTTRSNIKQATITVGDGTSGNTVSGFTVTGTFSDGNTRDATQLAETVSSSGVFQINIELGDSDGDAHADFIWSPRSNIAVTSQSESTNRSGLPSDAFEVSPAFVKTLPLYFNTNNASNQPVLLAGNHGSSNTPGPAARPGTPIGGIIVKGGKNPGGQMRQLQTNDYGEFEYKGLDAGNYRITAEYEIHINDQTIIEVGDADDDATTRAQDHNSSRSNKTASSIAPNPDGADTSKTKAQDHNSSRSNKTSSSVAPDPGGGSSTYSKVQVNSLLQTVLETEDLLNNDNTSNRTGVNTSRSNIKNLQNALFDLQRALNSNNRVTIQSTDTAVERQMQMLQSSLQNLGSRYTSISHVLKTKHDTAKNSIGNIR
jgi:hypothetical protein